MPLFRTNVRYASGTSLSLVLLVTACLAGRSAPVPATEGQVQEGLASYYADKFSGETTASGETYDPDALTAAHPTLPFGTHVRVTRIDAKEKSSVVVRINDRGPFAGRRIIDVSKAAARRLEMVQEGIVEVRIEVVDAPEEEEQPEARRTEGW